ncbi:hypothetical protein K493DRAFT_232096 [Basidiobolus meristosporus CBS 931.73]|uniref:Sulfate exporter family transporter n=1 Tax=Basidiobolus meristosporus CBS 931.73 TaxID=1314790 RepID=A0A1Y1XVY7_9FUNG|nr:hypothetical protein K493DRAFT_232096 [Basidiobolus meristosporus CBS 931.73]|eukprot:ORX89911.1 hypothetical protein K493DRAFT_232096 [Basidiobolus meristosporus CBS 931.73]
MFLVWLALWSCGKSIPSYFIFGYTSVFFLAMVSKIIAAQTNVKSASLSDSIWAIMLGMIVRNLLPKERYNNGMPAWLKIVHQTEFYIAISLVLLCIDFHILGPLAPKALLVSWIDTPIGFILVSWLGYHYMKIDLEFATITSGATFICGSSAAIALGNSINAVSKTELPIAIISIFTIPSIIALPYIARAFGFSSEVSGAWFGGCVDSTGAVIASATIYGSKEAVDTAAVVKMVQNIIIGPLAVAVALIWAHREERKALRACEDTEKFTTEVASSHSSKETPKKESNWWILWRRFPKFVLGFLATAIFFNTAIPANFRATTNSSAFIIGEWFSTLSFVSIGLGLNLLTLKRDAKLLASLSLLYVVAQMVDILTTLGLSILAFKII